MLHTLSLPVINRILKDDPWAARRLSQFSGATLHISLQDKTLLRYVIESDGLLATHQAVETDEPTLNISLPNDAVALWVSKGRQGVIKGAKIKGNIDLANTINEVMDQIRPDPEAFLATKIGDIAAHRAMQLITSFKAHVTQVGERIKDQFTEHVAEGQSVIVPNPQVKAFIDEVNIVRNDVARLEQRIARFTKQI